ncbi:hypothetical protein [Arcobacter cloacae]|uniref:Uncharacterized protein n=1 Tax=Arcobacter cloacae TaxID=1054034 RepID=A0A4Q0ZGA5_9BACT|nr:hypothetical protein [Arcobacter cloacae]RXJ85122.1 hypothetical protein CRU90_03965 [Arcobacter cloacae]
MIQNKNNNHTSNFSLFTNEELQYQSNIQEINLLTEKYSILENENKLISSTEKSFLYIINYTFNLFIEKKEIPKDIESLFLNNIFFKDQINDFLNKKLNNLINDNDNIHFTNEINLIIFITSIGINKNIINLSNEYDLQSLSEIFRFYENHLKNLFFKDKKLFFVTFNLYIILLKTLIQLIASYSINLVRKSDIFEIIELMTETINIVKFTIELDDYNLCKINNLQGKYLYYFSHLENISLENDDLDNYFKNYLLCLEKQEDGFTLSSNNNFGYEKDIDKDLEFFKFRNYASILLLKMIKDLKNKNINYYNHEYFQKIIRTYYKKFSIDENEKIANNIEEFEKILIKSFLYNYNFSSSTKTYTYQNIINDFILSNKNFDNKNLETIYRILFFVSEIKPYTFIHIAQILVDSNVIKNDYLEFFKLSIFNLFIKKFQDKNLDDNLDELFSKIGTYTLQNSFNSHLLSMCSRIYLNLSLLYSSNYLYIEKAKEFYVLFLFLSGDYKNNKVYIKRKNTIIENIKILNEEELIEEFLIKEKKELIHFLDLIENKSLHENKDFEQIKKSLSDTLENKIFYGLCKISIIQNEVSNILEMRIGLKKEFLYINSEFKIKFLIPKSNEKSFYTIFNYHKLNIQNKISIIINIFNQKKARFYIDDDEIELNF